MTKQPSPLPILSPRLIRLFDALERAAEAVTGLFAGSRAIARRLCLPVGVDTNTIYPNLYILFIGHSTRPRKTTALRVLRGLIEKADMSHFLLADRQTPEAFTLDLTTKAQAVRSGNPPAMESEDVACVNQAT